MLCSRTACGREIPDDAIYCPYCGKKQAAAPIKRTKHAPNGSGTVIKSGSGYKLIYRHVVDGRMVTRTKAGFPSKAAAREYLPTLKGQRAAPDVYTVAQLWAMLQKTGAWQAISPDKRGHYETAYKRLAELHNRDVAGIRFWEMQAIVEDLPGAFYPKRDAKTVLQKIFDLAVKNEVVPPGKADLVRYLELPSKPLTAQDARTPEEMRLIWQDWRAGHPAAGYALIMAYCGLRTGELTAISADTVDMAQRRICGGIKTAAGRGREIPIARDIAPVVASLLPSARVGLCAYDLGKFYGEFSELVRRTGIRPLRPYCQRHTCYTRLCESGAPQPVINAIIGHSNGKLGDTYGHISLQAKLDAVDAMRIA